MAKLRETQEGKQKQSEATKKWRERNPDKVAQARQLENIRRRSGWAYNEHVKAYKRMLQEKHDAHVTAFNVYKKGAPLSWWARYSKAIGEPWRNRMLPAAVQYRIRYAVSLEFRLSEINRNTHRKHALAERDDGTINFFELLRERKTCPYCDTLITKDNAVADHMDPMKLGGNNTKQNLTICCRSCNQKKRAKSFVDWLECLPEKQRAKALRWYVKKKGHKPEQQTMTFIFGGSSLGRSIAHN
jgi:hypothetical protein